MEQSDLSEIKIPFSEYNIRDIAMDYPKTVRDRNSFRIVCLFVRYFVIII